MKYPPTGYSRVQPCIPPSRDSKIRNCFISYNSANLLKPWVTNEILNCMNKTTTLQFIHPYSLKAGKNYLLRERQLDSGRKVPSIVKFVAYDPCPAFVIIQDSRGLKIRCLREDIFEINNNLRHHPSNLKLLKNRRQTNKVEIDDRHLNNSI